MDGDGSLIPIEVYKQALRDANAAALTRLLNVDEPAQFIPVRVAHVGKLDPELPSWPNVNYASYSSHGAACRQGEGDPDVRSRLETAVGVQKEAAHT